MHPLYPFQNLKLARCLRSATNFKVVFVRGSFESQHFLPNSPKFSWYESQLPYSTTTPILIMSRHVLT